ncbi:MAG: hypothetical protein V7L20_07035 [Nostoc sp.]
MGKVSEEKVKQLRSHLETHLTIKTNEWTPGGEIKVERSYTSLREVTRNIPSHPLNQPTVE